MDDLFRIGLTNAAWATALAVAVAALAWFMRRRPAVVHVLWLLVLIKLVTPSLTQVGFPGNGVAGQIAQNGPAAVSVSAGGRGSSEPPWEMKRLGRSLALPRISAGLPLAGRASREAERGCRLRWSLALRSIGARWSLLGGCEWQSLRVTGSGACRSSCSGSLVRRFGGHSWD